MAATATSTKPGADARVRARDRSLAGGSTRPKGNGSRGPRPPGGGGGGGRRREDETPFQYRIGVWVGLASIIMLFAALTSAYVFRAGGRGWQTTPAPPLLWASTALILASSVTFELARRGLKRNAAAVYRRWLFASLALGLGFLASQLLAWRQLVARGVYFASNPHSSFFYVLTSLHALHLAGGVAALAYLLVRTAGVWRASGGATADPTLRAKADAVGVYWHFMDVLWVYLFGLLFFWR
ncbi:MAG: cytochrome c oxidase subunit 3 [Acidobacteria bacterium]|nr:cytochrome c oxidase subunit 3 [Acidobacteriota bacterium]